MLCMHTNEMSNICQLVSESIRREGKKEGEGRNEGEGLRTHGLNVPILQASLFYQHTPVCGQHLPSYHNMTLV